MFKDRKHTPETIAKMRLARLGKKRAPFSEEWRKNISKSLLGNKRTSGIKYSEEINAKKGRKGDAHHNWGKSHSQETKDKIGAKSKGRTAWNKGKHYPAVSGEKNWNWKGGITPEHHKIRTSLEFSLWRKAVFTRDNFSCVECGLSGGWNKELKRKVVLNADHIKPFSLFPELRLAIDNGRTLCKECHIKTPTYGFKIRDFQVTGQ